MPSLRSLAGPARRLRHRPAAAQPGHRDDEVLLDVPDARLAPVLVAAADGDHAPAAALLAATRATAGWENRDRYLGRLAAFALSRDEWLSGWLAAAPGDPDALLVSAGLAVLRAWDSPARAELLREVGPLIDAAAAGDPRDPVPWRLALDHARGVHAAHHAFETLWEQALRRSPWHYGCHLAALRYLSAQWHGSHHECFDFAEQAADDAPPGSLVRALPVRAAYAYLLGGGQPAGALERIDGAADRAIALSAGYGPGDALPAEIRNLLVYVLVSRERWAEALEQFRLIGPYVTSFPWARLSDDPLDRFLELRDATRLLGNPAGARRDGPGRTRARGHYA
ncbi:hypothetical protein [Streptomyces sp. NBC_00859]|uniref:hypothetical protein n=1 Tax=Streptomyces sp. NBC_00859 TaxID=2903682 RepID=UPI00386F39E2|nr:hypothetical protein OG584_26735 [Streptomyces sp. NBC_00859]